MLLRRHRHGDGAAQCSKYYIFIKDALRSPVKSFALMSVIAFMAALVRTDVETNTRKRTRKCSERVYIILCTLPSGRRRLTTMSVGCDTPANRFEFFMFFFFLPCSIRNTRISRGVCNGVVWGVQTPAIA